MSRILKFPDSFLWGAATSSHQVEGSNNNNWARWEKQNAKRLARRAETRRQKKFPQIFDPQNYISGIATDHFNRFEDDFDMALSLGHNAHRFSLEWSRIEPREGVFNKKAINHYKKVISSLKERGIEPLVTIWHFTLPLWFEDRGGWSANDAGLLFTRYVSYVVSELKNDAKFWITINEPEVFLSGTYLKGSFPPGKRNLFACRKAFWQLVKGHWGAYRAIKDSIPASKVGIAKHIVPMIPFNPIGWCWNRRFLNQIADFQDFIGVNFYISKRITKAKERSDLGWGLRPGDIGLALKEAGRYKVPLFITENGLADADDKLRGWFIKETLKGVHQSLGEGVDVRGYFHWSLIDNFEWDSGFWPRFGLIEIDYKTLERKPRPSALFYSKICKSNKLEI